MEFDTFEKLGEQLSAHVKRTLQQIIKNEGYISYGINITNDITTLKKKKNYMGNIYEIIVKGKTEDGVKETCFFIKLPRQADYYLFTMKDVFTREAYAYVELFKIYEDLQNKANVPDKARYKSVKCFDGSSSEAIVLENLWRKSFKTWPRMEVVPLILAELSMKQLAKFHALSIVLEKERPDYFDSKVKTLDYMITIKSKESEAITKHVLNTSNNLLSEGSKKCLEKLMNIATEELNKPFGMNKMFKCLSHGDFKCDNLLYREQDCRIQEVIMIDHQIIHYGPPFNDFLFFIFLETDREFRRKHLVHLKNLYYISMKEFLKYFDMDLNSLWPREQFEKEYLESLNFALIHALLILPFTFADENDEPALESDLLTMDLRVEVDDRVRVRMQGIVDDFIEWQNKSASSSVSKNLSPPKCGVNLF